MDAYVQTQVRELITETDHLSRSAYAESAEQISEIFASVRTVLQRIDRVLGAQGLHAPIAGELDLVYQRIADAAARATPDQRATFARTLAMAESLRDHVHPIVLLLTKRSAPPTQSIGESIAESLRDGAALQRARALKRALLYGAAGIAAAALVFTVVRAVRA